MRFLIVSQYFYPEEFKVNDLAEALVRKGHQVTVLTGKPNYPKGEYFDGYEFKGVIEEDYKGAHIIRVPLVKRGKGGAINLAVNYLSFVLFGNRYIKKHRIIADAIICFEISPITQAYPGLICKKLYGGKFLLWVQDLWPESVTAAGGVKNPLVLKILDRLVGNIYKKSDKLLVQSKAFADSIVKKGDYSSKILYIPNWAEDIFCEPVKHDFSTILPKGFIVMFAGNVGASQDFESIIKAANLVRDNKEIKWVIIGEGRMRDAAAKQVSALRLNDTVLFLGRHPLYKMPSFFNKADAMLVTLRDEYIFSLTIPSKVQCYMASGKPILTMLNGVGNAIIEEAQCGLISNAGDYRQLAQNVLKMFSLKKEELQRMGDNALLYYKKHFDKNTVIDNIINSIC